MTVRQVHTPDAVNRKREKKGKRRLEDYYVIEYNAPHSGGDGQATGEGGKHGFRYDVCGHFRRLADGRTIWIAAHQRGLANETYKPKIYRV
jgi:hypothetical protein